MTMVSHFATTPFDLVHFSTCAGAMLIVSVFCIVHESFQFYGLRLAGLYYLL